MPSPFPGMDPYLERHNVWPDVHSALIVATRDALAPQVAPAYYVAIEERMYIVALDSAEFVGRPDVAIITAPIEARPARQTETITAVANVAQTVVLPQFEEVHERYLEIRDAQTHAVVTAIEILSPSNKAPGEGREAYEEKRRQVLSTRTNLVEVDLLRGGEAHGDAAAAAGRLPHFSQGRLGTSSGTALCVQHTPGTARSASAITSGRARGAAAHQPTSRRHLYAGTLRPPNRLPSATRAAAITAGRCMGRRIAAHPRIAIIRARACLPWLCGTAYICIATVSAASSHRPD